VLEISGGFGTIVGFVHDWANPENTFRSWDLVARYVVPEINGYVAGLRQSARYLVENRGVFERANQAVLAKIMENEKAKAALVQGGGAERVAISGSNLPDLEQAARRAKA
jgi:limonene 1,2-monooxygenase